MLWFVAKLVVVNVPLAAALKSLPLTAVPLITEEYDTAAPDVIPAIVVPAILFVDEAAPIFVTFKDKPDAFCTVIPSVASLNVPPPGTETLSPAMFAFFHPTKTLSRPTAPASYTFIMVPSTLIVPPERIVNCFGLPLTSIVIRFPRLWHTTPISATFLLPVTDCIGVP